MSRLLRASAAIAIGIALTPSVALAANNKHSRPHSQQSRQTQQYEHTQRQRCASGGADDRSRLRAPTRLPSGAVASAPADRARDLPRFCRRSVWPADRFGGAAVPAGPASRGRRDRGTPDPRRVGHRHARRRSWLPASRRLCSAVRSLQRRLAKAGFSPGPAGRPIRSPHAAGGHALSASTPPARRRDRRETDPGRARRPAKGTGSPPPSARPG